MIRSLADEVRKVALEMEAPEGDVVRKKKKAPEIKPPRRNPSTSNKSDRTDYMQKYMEKYRSDEGKSYQKIPESVKEFRKKQRQKAKKIARVHLEREAEKLYQTFWQCPEGKALYKAMEKKYPDYNNNQCKQATEFLFKKFMPWLEKAEPKFAKGGEWAEYKDEVGHRVKTKIRAGIT